MRLFILGETRTNNFSESMGQVIGEVWEASMEKIGEHSAVLYGVYHDYASDYRGDYTLSIATETLNMPSFIDVPDTSYQIFSVDSSKENGIFEAWQKIWQLENEGKLDRSYTFDYERYNIDGSVEIFIALN